jgi:hypothetical protein
MTGKRVLEPWEVRSAFRDPFIRRRLAALPPEQRATAFAEWEAEQTAKRKGKPIQAVPLLILRRPSVGLVKRLVAATTQTSTAGE